MRNKTKQEIAFARLRNLRTAVTASATPPMAGTTKERLAPVSQTGPLAYRLMPHHAAHKLGNPNLKKEHSMASLLQRLKGTPKSATDIQRLLDGIAAERASAEQRIEKLARERSGHLLDFDPDLLAACEEETTQLKRTIARLDERAGLLQTAKEQAAAAEARTALERRHSEGQKAAKEIDKLGLQWDTACASILTLAGQLRHLSEQVLNGDAAGRELGLPRITHKADSDAWTQISLSAAYPDRTRLDQIDADGKARNEKFEADRAKYQADLADGVIPTRIGSAGIHGVNVARAYS